MTAAPGTTPKPVTTTPAPPVRRMRFRFTDPKSMNRHFIDDNIPMSHLLALLSAAFPAGEESFIRSVRRFAGEYDDPSLKKRVAGFIGQEAVHGQQHRELNDRLIDLGYIYARMSRFEAGSRRERMVIAAENRMPRKLHLAITAASEHFTAVLAHKILSSDEIQAIPGDPEVWNLLNWHVYEELEHKSVAFDVYRAVGGGEPTRIGVMAVVWVGMLPFFIAQIMASMALDRTAWHPIKVARGMVEMFRGPFFDHLMSEMATYMRPGFHPDDQDTTALLERWRTELFGPESGTLVDRIR